MNKRCPCCARKIILKDKIKWINSLSPLVCSNCKNAITGEYSSPLIYLLLTPVLFLSGYLGEIITSLYKLEGIMELIISIVFFLIMTPIVLFLIILIWPTKCPMK